MTFLNSMPSGDPAKDGCLTDGVGPLVCIGMPHQLAKALAGARPMIALGPTVPESDGLGDLSGASVACLLLGGRTDALDVIDILATKGFRGEVVVVCPPVPNAAMIRAELKAAAPGMTVTLTEM